MKKPIYITFSYICALTFSFFVFFCCAQTLNAQPVTLDPTFGQNGMTVQNSGWGSTFVFDKLGNIINTGVSGNAVVMIKTSADGIIDKNFGNNGQIYVDENYILSSFEDLKITNDNKILLLGDHEDNYTGIILRRFNENGSIDNTFGDNGVMNLTSITGAHQPSSFHVSSVNLENDDFMLIGMTELMSGFIAVQSYISKYNYDGELDESFGENGRVYLTDNETYNIHPCYKSVKILSDQSIVIAGYDNFKDAGTMYTGKLAFCKLSPTGNLVANFANNGIWINSDPEYSEERFNSIIEGADSNLIFTASRFNFHGSIGGEFIYNFYPDGTINSGFGTNGNCSPFTQYAGALRVVQNGTKYLVRDRYNIMSINNNGTIDTTFNNTGVFRFENSTFRAMKLQNADKLVVVGSVNDKFSIVRLNIPSNLSVNQFNNSDNSTIIFPNPTKDYLNFNTEQQFEIMDMQGRILLKSKHATQSVNVSHLKIGIYFIKFKDGCVEKFVKE